MFPLSLVLENSYNQEERFRVLKSVLHHILFIECFNNIYNLWDIELNIDLLLRSSWILCDCLNITVDNITRGTTDLRETPILPPWQLNVWQQWRNSSQIGFQSSSNIGMENQGMEHSELICIMLSLML